MSSVDRTRKKMQLAVVCGDGLPISGLLTTLRNVVDLIPCIEGCSDIVRQPIPTDLGYSWRPDKTQFFPHGPRTTAYPPWMSVSRETPVLYDDFAQDLTRIRHEVAVAETLSQCEKRDLRQRIDEISLPYERYFSDWFEKHDVDWVIAINMTLSDAASVTQAMYRAGKRRWGNNRPGGIVFWDHDLFGSYAVVEHSQRVYPAVPNAFTPVPQKCAWQVWVLASPVLAQETKRYPTEAEPFVVPLVLPVLTPGTSASLDGSLTQDFLLQLDLLHKVTDGHRLILCPVRIFPVKGVDISIRVLAALNRLCRKNGEKESYLLVFGDLDEDEAYAAHIRKVIADEDTADRVVFLEGVPLASIRHNGRVKLDEKDLLRLCASTHGGVFFTPSVPDVESVGLGPALAAIAGVPCVVSNFVAFDIVYGKDFHAIKTGTNTASEIHHAAQEFFDKITENDLQSGGIERHSQSWSEELTKNRNIVAERFPTEPWEKLLKALISRVVRDPGASSQTRQGIEDTNRRQGAVFGNTISRTGQREIPALKNSRIKNKFKRISRL